MMQFATFDSEAQTLNIAGRAPIVGREIERHFDALTHFPERRARLELCALAHRLNGFSDFVHAIAKRGAADDFDAAGEAARFTAKHIALTQAYWAREGRTMSAFIVGPARFPTARNEKRMRASDAARDLIGAHEARARKSATRRAFPFGMPGEPIRANDPEAFIKLRAELAALEEKHTRGLALNKAWRKHGRPAHDDAESWGKIADTLGQPLEEFDELRGIIRRVGRISAPYFTANTNANMRRLDDRITALERMHERGRIEKDFGFCQMIEDPEAARVQLIFAGKPDDKTRATLKAHGFRWAPSQGAWQRHLNNNGRQAARFVIEELGGKVQASPPG